MYVAQPERDRDRVEAIVSERQRQRIPGDKAQTGVAATALGQHPQAHIGSNHERPGIGDRAGTAASAGGQVQHDLARLRGQRFQCRLAPERGQPKRGQGIDHVVPRRQPVEHRGHIRTVLGQGGAS